MTTIPLARPAREQATPVFAWLVDTGLTAVGVPAALGGTGGDRDEALREILRLQRIDPEAAAVLASHQCVIGSLLSGDNARLRDLRVPALARGRVSGIWPGAAVDDMLHRGTASVHAREVAGGLSLSGPLGRVHAVDGYPMLIVCPMQWSTTHPPGLALLGGENSGLRWQATLLPNALAPHLKLASLDEALCREDDWVGADGVRLAMTRELQGLHAAVTRWLEQFTSLK